MRAFTMLGAATVAAAATGAFTPGANAQETTQILSCQDIGPSAPEPLGDREGHSILTATASCHVDSGFMSGGVLTGADIWEWNGPKAALLSASGVVRKPGGTLVYTETSATLELTMADGKMTGWSSRGVAHIRSRPARLRRSPESRTPSPASRPVRGELSGSKSRWNSLRAAPAMSSSAPRPPRAKLAFERVVPATTCMRPAMKRVAVFGNAGGGKSTLAKRLSEMTKLPLHPIDLI